MSGPPAPSKPSRPGLPGSPGLVDGKHANGWGDIMALVGDLHLRQVCRAVPVQRGCEPLRLPDGQAGRAAGFDSRARRWPASAQKGIVIRGAQGQPIQMVPVWRGVELIVDPYTNAGKGQRTITAVTLVGSPFVPYGTAQVVEVHPKLS